MGVNRDDHGILELFKKGLKNGLLISIIGLPTFNPNTPWNFAQWEEAAQKQHNKWKVQQQYKKGNKVKCQALHQVFGLARKKGGQARNPSCVLVSQGGNAMDIDAINSLSEAEKNELIKLNACFYCKKQGHHASV